MASISLCMIVKNEEDVLTRCLEGVRGFVDEIVIVDTGSQDRTRQVAEKYTDKIYDFPWDDDFSAARNYGLEKATKEYCMWLDADDVILPEEAEKIQRLKKILPKDVDTVMMKYATAFDEWGRPSFTYYRERILKNCSQCRFQGRVHEVIVPFGNILYEDIQIEHRKIRVWDPQRNLRIYEKMYREGQILEPREVYYYGRELLDHGRARDACKQFRKFLGMSGGWKEDKKEACRLLAYCYFLEEKRKKGVRTLLRALEYGQPGAALCCDLGKYFFDRGEWKDAVFWYEQALREDKEVFGFCQENCRGYLPCIQLCVCWYQLGDYDRARHYHQEAGRWNPKGEEYLKNVPFFETDAYGK